MLQLSRDGQTLTIDSGVSTIKWDAARGGQIVELVAKDELFSHPLLRDGRVLPDLRLVANGRPLPLSDATGKLEVIAQSPDHVVLRNTAALLDGALHIEQQYDVFAEGVVFCEQAIELPGGEHVDLADASMNLSIDTRGTQCARWGYYGRQPWYKRDYSTIHALMNFSLFRALDQTEDLRELLPLVSLDLGWPATRFFSTRMEFMLEDWTHFNDGPLEKTRTRAGHEDDRWQLHWHFHDGGTIELAGPCRYRNRWGFTVSRARTRSGAGVDPTVRNNVLGCRIAHCMYPYAREGGEWPWVVMPIKQIPEQPPQLFTGLPDPARADEAADEGATVMILHQFWMRNPGSNNEPVADYQPLDPKWLKGFVDRCHKRHLRVLLYARGTEMWQMYSTFFEDFLQKDYDGIYNDWATPLGMGYIKCSPLHFSAYNCFQFSRAVRKRVGDQGTLIGHTGNATSLALATYDAAVGGEFSVRHDELLSDPERSSYYSLVDCSGAHLISGNLPDREAFSGPMAVAVCAALGMTGHPFMEPDAHFREPSAYIKPLWRTMQALPGNVVQLHNPTYSPTRAIRTDAPDLYPSCFQSDRHKAVLLVTNLSPSAARGTVHVDLRELDVPANAKLQPLSIDGVQSCTVDGTTVTLDGVASMRFCAVLIG